MDASKPDLQAPTVVFPPAFAVSNGSDGGNPPSAGQRFSACRSWSAGQRRLFLRHEDPCDAIALAVERADTAPLTVLGDLVHNEAVSHVEVRGRTEDLDEFDVVLDQVEVEAV